MSLSRKIAAALESSIAADALPGTIAASEGAHRLTLGLLRAAPVGVEADGLEFRADDRDDRTLDDLRAWGDRLAARVTYLMEPLVVLEVDAAGVEVELRSQSPTARAGLRSYYEVRLSRPGTLRLLRVSYDESARRRRTVPFQLTVEVLERLADDLVASVA